MFVVNNLPPLRPGNLKSLAGQLCTDQPSKTCRRSGKGVLNPALSYSEQTTGCSNDCTSTTSAFLTHQLWAPLTQAQELWVCPGPPRGSSLAGGSLGTEEGRPSSCSLLMSDLVNPWKFTSLQKQMTNTHPLGNVMMSRAREALGLFFKGFLQRSCQVTPLFKSILQAFSPTVHSSWRLLTTKQQCHTSTWLAVLLQHFFAPFSFKFLVSDDNIYIKNTKGV